jgi:hypothetical protein
MLAPIRPSAIMPNFTKCSSTKQEASEGPTPSNEKDYPNEVASPSPRLVAKVCWLRHRGGPQGATPLDIPGVGRPPSTVAPAIANR